MPLGAAFIPFEAGNLLLGTANLPLFGASIPLRAGNFPLARGNLDLWTAISERGTAARQSCQAAPIQGARRPRRRRLRDHCRHPAIRHRRAPSTHEQA